MRVALALAFALAIPASPAATPAATPATNGTAAVTTEKVSFPVARALERDAAVVGELRLPVQSTGRLPAVVIVNSSPGFDGRGAAYAQALNQAGVATLEVDLFQGRGLPASPRHNLPHVYQALHYLARHARIDQGRVGIMGFSWGGSVALLASSETLARQFAGGDLRFAAHVGLYPVCWRHEQKGAGARTAWKDIAGAYDQVKRPVHILVGDKDDYGGPDTCRRFIASLPAEARRRFELTVYPGATFAWDSRFGSAVWEAGANEGRGGIVTVVADPETTKQSLQSAVAWFLQHLKNEEQK